MTTQLKLISILLIYNAASIASESASKVTLFNDIEWGYLNPLRGDQSPGAADLWGDRTAEGATGMLVRFNQGFTSPPHIHNISYRGIVIEGQLHNDDASAENMWLPPGSFWTQPAGQAHITAANGQSNLAYVEIDSGPYLVKPTDESFDNGEKPVNLDQSNLVWLNAADLKWTKIDDAKTNHAVPEISFLWGSAEHNQLNGLMLKLPPKFKGEIQSQSTVLRSVVIAGKLYYADAKELKPGSYFESNGQSSHAISTANDTTILYIRTAGKFELLVH